MAAPGAPARGGIMPGAAGGARRDFMSSDLVDRLYENTITEHADAKQAALTGWDDVAADVQLLTPPAGDLYQALLASGNESTTSNLGFLGGGPGKWHLLLEPESSANRLVARMPPAAQLMDLTEAELSGFVLHSCQVHGGTDWIARADLMRLVEPETRALFSSSTQLTPDQLTDARTNAKQGFSEACQALEIRPTGFYVDVVTALGAVMLGGAPAPTAAGAAFAAIGPVQGVPSSRHAALAGMIRYIAFTKVEEHVRAGYRTRQAMTQAGRGMDGPGKDRAEKSLKALADNTAAMLILHSTDKTLEVISEAMLASTADCMAEILTDNTRQAIATWTTGNTDHGGREGGCGERDGTYFRDLALRAAVTSASFAATDRFATLIDRAGDDSEMVRRIITAATFFEVVTGSWIFGGAAVLALRQSTLTAADMTEIANNVSLDLAPHADWHLSLLLVRLASGHALSNNDLAVSMRRDRLGKTGIDTPWAVATTCGWAAAGYVSGKQSSLIGNLFQMGTLVSGLYRTLDLAAASPYLKGAIAGVRAVTAAATVMEMLQLFTRIFGAEADLFAFVDLPLTPDRFFEESRQILANPLRYARFGAYMLPGLAGNTKALDDHKKLAHVLGALSGAMDSIADKNFLQAASLHHQGRKAPVASVFARLFEESEHAALYASNVRGFVRELEMYMPELACHGAISAYWNQLTCQCMMVLQAQPAAAIPLVPHNGHPFWDHLGQCFARIRLRSWFLYVDYELDRSCRGFYMETLRPA
ncbi:unnamed protein product [Symbiodinium sp. CCMP2592]|nr:unnamed protein product [Symbiodinium sp. CCMP2592]